MKVFEVNRTFTMTRTKMAVSMADQVVDVLKACILSRVDLLNNGLHH